MSAGKPYLKNYVIIPLTHHKNSGYTELKVLDVYFSPAAGGEKIYNAQLSFCLPYFFGGGDVRLKKGDRVRIASIGNLYRDREK